MEILHLTQTAECTCVLRSSFPYICLRSCNLIAQLRKAQFWGKFLLVCMHIYVSEGRKFSGKLVAGRNLIAPKLNILRLRWFSTPRVCECNKWETQLFSAKEKKVSYNWLIYYSCRSDNKLCQGDRIHRTQHIEQQLVSSWMRCDYWFILVFIHYTTHIYYTIWDWKALDLCFSAMCVILVRMNMVVRAGWEVERH